MLNAEKTASIAWLGGAVYPADRLNEAWKKVLANQFHDTAAGSAVASVYADARRDYESVRQATSEVTDASIKNISAHIDTQVKPGSVPLVIFNPLGWNRSDVVEAEVQMPRPVEKGIEVLTSDGRPVLTQVLHEDKATSSYRLLLRADDVPSVGYVVLQVRDGKTQPKSDLSATASSLENSLVKLKLDSATGCITELSQTSSSFNSIAAGGCGNELQTFVDTPKNFDAWDYDLDALSKMAPLHAVDSIQLVESGPLRASIRVERHFGQSKFVQYLRLTAGSSRVDVDNDFDWQETHVMLKVAFPLAASSENATYEIPYGSIQRPTTPQQRDRKGKI